MNEFCSRILPFVFVDKLSTINEKHFSFPSWGTFWLILHKPQKSLICRKEMAYSLLLFACKLSYSNRKSASWWAKSSWLAVWSCVVILRLQDAACYIASLIRKECAKLLIYFNEYTQKIEASVAYELVFEPLVTAFYNNPKDQHASTNFIILSGPSRALAVCPSQKQ